MAAAQDPSHAQQIKGGRRAGWWNQAARACLSDWTSPRDWSSLRLRNGLRLILIPRPGTPTVAVRAYVRAGSRYDGEHRRAGSDQPCLGLAHLVEHLLFKGTRRYSQRQLFAAIEQLGGVLDAGTAKEYLCLSAVVPPHGLSSALDCVVELLAEPTLREEDFWGEKLVVLEELRRAHDREDRIFDLFAEALWQEHPLRYPVLGTLPGLQAADYASLLDFYRQRFVAGNSLLALCGDFDPAEAGTEVAERFAVVAAGAEQRPAPIEQPPLSAPRTVHLERDLHQTSLLLGAPTVRQAHADRSALQIIERVLGMGGSARLYQRLREERRLVYSVRTVTAVYEDAGYLAVHCACDPETLPQVQGAILEEWQRLCYDGVSDEELAAAQGNYVGTLARRFETNSAVAGIFGVEGLLGEIEPFDAAVRRILAVTQDDVIRVARTYLDGTRYIAATIGRNM